MEQMKHSEEIKRLLKYKKDYIEKRINEYIKPHKDKIKQEDLSYINQTFDSFSVPKPKPVIPDHVYAPTYMKYLYEEECHETNLKYNKLAIFVNELYNTYISNFKCLKCIDCSCVRCETYENACPKCVYFEEWFNHICIGIYDKCTECNKCNRLRTAHQGIIEINAPKCSNKRKLKILKTKHKYIENIVNKHILPYQNKLKYHSYKIKCDDDKLTCIYLHHIKEYHNHILDYLSDYLRREKVLEDDKLNTIIDDLKKEIKKVKQSKSEYVLCTWGIIHRLEYRINEVGILIPREFPEIEKDILYITQTFETLDYSNPSKEMNKKYNDLAMFVNDFYNIQKDADDIKDVEEYFKRRKENSYPCAIDIEFPTWSEEERIGCLCYAHTHHYDMFIDEKNGIKYCRPCERNVKFSNCADWFEEDCIGCYCYACAKYKDIICPICEDEEQWFNHICIGIYKARIRCSNCNKLRRLHQESKHKCGICIKNYNAYKKSEVYKPKKSEVYKPKNFSL